MFLASYFLLEARSLNVKFTHDVFYFSSKRDAINSVFKGSWLRWKGLNQKKVLSTLQSYVLFLGAVVEVVYLFFCSVPGVVTSPPDTRVGHAMMGPERTKRPTPTWCVVRKAYAVLRRATT